MEIQGSVSGINGGLGNTGVFKYVLRDDTAQPADMVSLGQGSDSAGPSKALKEMSLKGGGVEKSLFKAVYHPSDDDPSRPMARHNTPVVIVHGTLTEESSIKSYKDAATHTGHAANLTTYSTIKEGKEIQESGKILSRNINETRLDVTRRHLKKLDRIKANPEALKKYFEIDEKGKGADQVTALLPGVIEGMKSLTEGGDKPLLDTFSTRVRDAEQDLAHKVKESGFGSWEKNPEKRDMVCGKVAAEVMDRIAPRAVLVGHSMGGFLSYALAISPKADLQDKSKFTYDAGNGVSTVITLSSPIKSGVAVPLPTGLVNVGYDLAQKHYLDPMEGTPGMQLAMMNPFFSMWYAFNKAATKETYKNMTLATAMMTNPAIYAKNPGYRQISEGSDFMKEHIQGRSVPDGVTLIAVTNKLDGVSEQERSVADESRPNAHNLDADVQITKEDLKDFMETESRAAHKKMSKYPFEHGEEFRKEVLEDPAKIVRVLHPANYDGVRWRCLKVMEENQEADPSLLRRPEYSQVRQTLQEVASEGIPFKDSPSYLAARILERDKD